MDFIIQLWSSLRCQFCPAHLAINIKMFLFMIPFFGLMFVWMRNKLKKHVKEEQKSHHSCCHTRRNDPCQK